MSLLRPARRVKGIAACTHGGINYAEIAARGLQPSSLIDLSVCTNPYMPPEYIKEVIAETVINRYPDSDSGELKDLIASTSGISSRSLLIGSGTTELIRLVTLAYLEEKNTAIIITPTYGEYEQACRMAGARIVPIVAGTAKKFIHDIGKIIDIISKCGPAMVFICNPNNPTGIYFERAEIEEILRVLNDGLLVLDEAYVSFVEGRWNASALIESGRLLILRSMTKDYGLTGLRIGYAMGAPGIIDVLQKVCPPWNVNAAAQRVAARLLQDGVDLRPGIEMLIKSRDHLMKEMRGLGHEVLPSRAHFFLVHTCDAAAYRDVLLDKGILVRDCSSFGLHEYIRISPGTERQCRRFLEVINAIEREGIAH